MYQHSIWQKFAAEFFGTFFLTLASVGTAILAFRHPDAASQLGHSFATPLLVLALIYALGNVSGAHLNPAITLAFYLRRVFPGSNVFGYIFFQIMGAIAASIFVSEIIGDASLGLTLPKDNWQDAAAMEFVMTLLLGTVVLGTATRHSLIGAGAAIPVAATILLCELLGGSISGASMNPARSLGPALVAGKFEHLGLYCIVPLIGSAAAVVVSSVLHSHKHKWEQKAASGE